MIIIRNEIWQLTLIQSAKRNIITGEKSRYFPVLVLGILQNEPLPKTNPIVRKSNFMRRVSKIPPIVRILAKLN